MHQVCPTYHHCRLKNLFEILVQRGALAGVEDQAAYAAPPAAQQGAAAGGPATLPQIPAIVQEKLDAAARLAAEGDRRRLLILLGVLAVLLIAFLALMWAIFGH